MNGTVITADDTDPDYGQASVVIVTGAAKTGGTASSVAGSTTSVTGTEITGIYGTLKIGSDGTYTYMLNNAAGSAADKLAAGEKGADIFDVTITTLAAPRQHKL